MCVLIHWNSMDSTLAEKVLKKTLLDLQKRFSIHHVCPKYLAAHFCGSAFPENGSAIHQDLDEVMKKKPLDLQKRFPIYHAYSKYLAAYRCGSAFTQDGLASLQDHDKVEITPFDWERGTVHCALPQHL